MSVSGAQEGLTAVPTAVAESGQAPPRAGAGRPAGPGRTFWIALAVANLCFINAWYGLQELDPMWVNYFRPHLQYSYLLATLADGLLLAAALWVAWRLAIQSGKPALRKLAECGFLVTLIFPLELVRQIWSEQNSTPGRISEVALLITELSVAAGAIQVLRGNRRLLNAAKMAAFASNLLFASMLVHSFFSWLGAPSRAEFADQPTAPFHAVAGKTPPVRVVWLLFDEMDQWLSFAERPASVHMPEIDRLKAESLSATAAQPTALWTSVAIPSLFSGLPIAKAEPKGPSGLSVTASDGRRLGSWDQLPNLFRDAEKLGVNTGLIGWHHPYCRVFGSATNYCASETGFDTGATYADQLGLGSAMDFLIRRQWDALLRAFRVRTAKPTDDELAVFGRRHQLEQYLANRRRALEVVRDPRYGLIYVHWPIPHPVGIYNRHTHDFNHLDDTLSYLDNLELVDVTFGELRRAMESAGLWDSTTLLITADHGFRPDVWEQRLKWMTEAQVDPRNTQARPIPFLLHFPGEHSGLVYSKPFSSLLTHDLILALLSGSVSTPEQARGWLEGNRARFPLREDR